MSLISKQYRIYNNSYHKASSTSVKRKHKRRTSYGPNGSTRTAKCAFYYALGHQASARGIILRHARKTLATLIECELTLAFLFILAGRYFTGRMAAVISRTTREQSHKKTSTCDQKTEGNEQIELHHDQEPQDNQYVPYCRTSIQTRQLLVHHLNEF